MASPLTRIRLTAQLDPDKARTTILAAFQLHGTYDGAAEALDTSVRSLHRLVKDLDLAAIVAPLLTNAHMRPRRTRNEPETG